MRSSVARIWVAGVIIVLASLPAAAHDGTGKFTCSGSAPVATSCNTGLHSAFNWYELGIPDRPAAEQGLLVYSNYSGSIETRLDWPAVDPTQFRSFRCDVSNGSVVASTCVSVGFYPPPTVHFVHRCYSWRVGSSTQRGGSGSWGCYVDHDASPVVGPAIGVGLPES